MEPLDRSCKITISGVIQR